MRVVIIGAGPTGLFLGAALARRGHDAVAIERDAGPQADGSWPRRGVMQFRHAHAFRGQVVRALQDELPEAYDAWVTAGAEPVMMPLPDGSEEFAAMRSRRETFERALRATAEAQTGLVLRIGHADSVITRKDRAVGVRLGDDRLEADLVIDASGRAGRVTRNLRASPTSGGPCGIAYVDRLYRLRPGMAPPPMPNPIAWQADCAGYQVLVFVHERGLFSVLISRPTDDPHLPLLRHEAAFEAACQAIPGLAEWTDPGRARPVSPVHPGGTLTNHYRGQRDSDGRLAVPGLLFVGDAVATTTPIFGRGVTTSLLQAREVLRLIDEHGADAEAVGEEFDAWCESNMRPWVDDHIGMDGARRRRWAGEDIDLTVPRLPSDVIMMAAAEDPRIGAGIGGYLSMEAGPSSLDAVEPLAREVYAGGWRREPDPGPTRAELAEIVLAALAPGDSSRG